VTNNLDTLATALYVKTGDQLRESPQLEPWRPGTGIPPRLSDSELVTLAVPQALPGFTSEARWLRHARAAMGHLFPYLPQQPGYNLTWLTFADLREMHGIDLRLRGVWAENLRTNRCGGRVSC
jgi:hypothetical protein